MMDGRVASVGLTALFTWRVSRFPGCSDIVQLLDGVKGLGAAFINQIRSPAQSLGVKVSLTKKRDDESFQFGHCNSVYVWKSLKWLMLHYTLTLGLVVQALAFSSVSLLTFLLVEIL